MKKYLMMAFLASFIGIMANPETLMASDKVAVSDIRGAVETVIIKPEISEAPENVVIPTTPNTAVAVKTAPATVTAASVYVAPANYIQIAGQTLETVAVNAPRTDVGSEVYSYNNKFFYAHNPGKFTVITGLSIGSAINVSVNGAVRTYHVTDKVQLSIEALNAKSELSNAHNIVSVNAAIQKNAYYNGKYHGIVMQTCVGNERLFVFAD